MGFTFTGAAAVLGVSLLIMLEILAGNLLPAVSHVNESYNDLKERLVKQDETAINITNISDVGWWDTDWEYRKLILINHSQVADDLTNFPVLIDITDGHLSHSAATDGRDIAFVSGDNTTKYNHEIELYSSTSGGHLIAWVNVTKVYKDVDTWFFMYYGNSGASNQSNPAGVWDSNYTMVQHLEEPSGTLKDSTSNNNNGTNNNFATYTASGKIDGAYNFDGNIFQFINVSTLNNGHDYESGDFTVSLWFKTAKTSVCLISDYYSIPAGSACYGWHVYIDNNGKLQYIVGTGAGVIRGTTTVNTDTWHHVVVVDRGETTVTHKNTLIYLDGNIEADASRDQKSTNANRKFLISAFYTSLGYSGYYTGTTDEVVLSNMTRESSWINTSYKNMNSPSTFIHVESEQTQAYTYLNITVNNTGSTNLNIGRFTLLVNGTKTSFVYLQPYFYPEKETTMLVSLLNTTADVFNATSSDGYIYASSGLSYAIAHNAATGTVNDAVNQIVIGQRYTSTIRIDRGYVFFDTSPLPDTATIYAATLSLYGVSTNITKFDFNITIQHGLTDPTPHDPLVPADYYYNNYTGNGGVLDTFQGFAINQYNDISMNSTGISWISKTGTTKLCLRSSRDINNATPGAGNEEFVNITGKLAVGVPNEKPSQLTIYYSASGLTYRIKMITENGKVDYGECTL